MEHTKGKLEAKKAFDMEGMRHIFIKTEKGYIFGRIDGHLDGLACGKPDISMDEAKANARHLVTCWNEHDTLTAEAIRYRKRAQVAEAELAKAQLLNEFYVEGINLSELEIESLKKQLAHSTLSE
jgi:hypothetical protein